MNHKIFFNHVEWTYAVHLLRDGEPTTLPTHCTLSNEERRDVLGPLQNKWGIFKEQLVDLTYFNREFVVSGSCAFQVLAGTRDKWCP